MWLPGGIPFRPIRFGRGAKLRPLCRRPLEVRGALLGGRRPLLCVPMVAFDEGEVEASLGELARFGPDLVELRADFWGFLEDLPRALAVVARARDRLEGIPLLLTCREASEGGARSVPREVKTALYLESIGKALVDLVDVELSMGYDYIRDVKAAAARRGVVVVVSWHDFSGTPSEDQVLSVISREVYCGADVAKVAVMARDGEDVLRLLLATRRARSLFPDVPLAAMSMGEMGVLSRLMGFAFGSDLAFASLGRASAPGQVDAPLLRGIFSAFERLGLWGR